MTTILREQVAGSCRHKARLCEAMERLDGRVALLEPPAKPSPKDFRKACVKPSSAETSPESFSGSTGAESVLEHLGEAISPPLGQDLVDAVPYFLCPPRYEVLVGGDADCEVGQIRPEALN